MPYSLAVNDIIEVIDQQLMNGQVIYNVYHYTLADLDGPVVDGAAYITDVITKLASPDTGLLSVINAQSTAIQHTRMTGQKISPVRYRRVTYGTADIGLIAGVASPQNVQASVTLFAEVAGRSGIGRKAIAGLPAANVVGGTLSGVVPAKLNDYGAIVVADLTVTSAGVTSLWLPLILNRSNPALSLRPTTYTTQPTTRVARRRTVGLGI